MTARGRPPLLLRFLAVLLAFSILSVYRARDRQRSVMRRFSPFWSLEFPLTISYGCALLYYPDLVVSVERFALSQIQPVFLKGRT